MVKYVTISLLNPWRGGFVSGESVHVESMPGRSAGREGVGNLKSVGINAVLGKPHWL